MTNGNESQESGDISRAEVTSQLGCEAGASQGQCRPGSWNVRVLAWNPKGQQACWWARSRQCVWGEGTGPGALAAAGRGQTRVGRASPAQSD